MNPNKMNRRVIVDDSEQIDRIIRTAVDNAQRDDPGCSLRDAHLLAALLLEQQGNSILFHRDCENLKVGKLDDVSSILKQAATKARELANGM